MGLKKNTFQIVINGKPIYTGVTEDVDTSIYLTRKRQSDKNLVEFIQSINEYKEKLEKKIATLEKEIRHLKGED